MKKDYRIKEILSQFPKERHVLPKEYLKIFDEHYKDSREGRTAMTAKVTRIERWLHKQVLKTQGLSKRTLEIGAGTLNHLEYEKPYVYDIVEPYKKLYKDSKNYRYIRNVYDDIKDIPENEEYDRIISIACFEHICDLPDVVYKCVKLLSEDGCMSISIPNEGRFLWHFAYTISTGREFKKKFGLDYETWMHYEHVNTADEIDAILRYFFQNVNMKLCGLNRDLSIYRYYECYNPKKELHYPI